MNNKTEELIKQLNPDIAKCEIQQLWMSRESYIKCIGYYLTSKNPPIMYRLCQLCIAKRAKIMNNANIKLEELINQLNSDMVKCNLDNTEELINQLDSNKIKCRICNKWFTTTKDKVLFIISKKWQECEDCIIKNIYKKGRQV